MTGIYWKNPDALFKPITAGRHTMFHIAARKERAEVLQALVKMVPQSKKRELLKMKNILGNTILHEVAASTNIKAANILNRELLYSDGPMNHEIEIREREEILADRNKLGETSLFRAAGWGNKQMVMRLASEIERVGNLHDHYKRDDQVSILHAAVIGQHFDTAIWFLKKDPQLVTYKDNDGMTCLHFLANMPTAFPSSYLENEFTSGTLTTFIYRSLPSSWPYEDVMDQLPFNPQNKDLEQGEPSRGPDQSECSEGNCKSINLDSLLELNSVNC
ncbi:hypothetical protein DITRI_Ditri19aG0010500 [Diplodiscus trichospermus]